METKTLTYCGITAEVGLWHSLGISEYSGGTKFEDMPCRESFSPSDGDLAEARIASGSNDGRALVWLIQERRRRAEHEAQLAATRKQGDDAIHAARIQRQAAELECRARGLTLKQIEKVFE